MSQEEALTRAVPWIVATFGGGGLWAILRTGFGLYHQLQDLKREVAELKAVVNGDPTREDDWSVVESKRRLRAALTRVDQFHEIVAGEHGFYSKFAKYDEQIKVWATWRHDVIDKELNRLALEIGTLEDDHEKTKAEVALCERRK